MRRTNWRSCKPNSNHVAKIMKEVLGAIIGKVIVTDFVVDSSFVLLTSEHGRTAIVERIMKA